MTHDMFCTCKECIKLKGGVNNVNLGTSEPQTAPQASSNIDKEAELKALGKRIRQLCEISENDGKNGIVYFPKPFEYGPPEIIDAFEALLTQAKAEARLAELEHLPRSGNFVWCEDIDKRIAELEDQLKSNGEEL